MVTSRAEPAWLQTPTPMTAATMTARIATGRTLRRGAGRVRELVAEICVAMIVLLDSGPSHSASAARWQVHDPAGRSMRPRRRLYLPSMSVRAIDFPRHATPARVRIAGGRTGG